MANPAPPARELGRRLWDGGADATAVFTPIFETAFGLYRAAWELGLEIGRDVSLCSFGNVEQCKLFSPSLTTIVTAELRPLLIRGLDWIVSNGRDWEGPWRLAPTDLDLFVGESTGPARF